MDTSRIKAYRKKRTKAGTAPRDLLESALRKRGQVKLQVLEGGKPRVLNLSVDDITSLAASLADVDSELTTTEAARLLNVSRPFLVGLLDSGAIPFRKVGSHRRVQRSSILEYKDQMYRQAEDALQELTDQAQVLDIGYDS